MTEMTEKEIRNKTIDVLFLCVEKVVERLEAVEDQLYRDSKSFECLYNLIEIDHQINNNQIAALEKRIALLENE